MSVGQQPLDATGGADLGLPVRAKNRSDVDVVWQYDRIRHVIPAHGEAIVPYMAMVMWQGDPRAIDVPGGRQHEQFRRQQREHLRILYGVYENEERWAEIPLVECYPLNSDLRFETVLHDPDGVHLSGEAETANQSRYLRQQVEEMAAQMRVLQARAAMSEQQEAAQQAAGLSPDDLDRQETEHRTVTPEEATGQSMVGPAPERRTQPVPKGGRAARESGAAVTRDGE